MVQCAAAPKLFWDAMSNSIHRNHSHSFAQGAVVWTDPPCATVVGCVWHHYTATAQNAVAQPSAIPYRPGIAGIRQTQRQCGHAVYVGACNYRKGPGQLCHNVAHGVDTPRLAPLQPGEIIRSVHLQLGVGLQYRVLCG